MTITFAGNEYPAETKPIMTKTGTVMEVLVSTDEYEAVNEETGESVTGRFIKFPWSEAAMFMESSRVNIGNIAFTRHESQG